MTEAATRQQQKIDPVYFDLVGSKLKRMAHLAILFRTVEEIKDCTLYTRECGEMVLDTRGQRTSYLFPLQENIPDFWHLEGLGFKSPTEVGGTCQKMQHLQPHRNIRHVVFYDGDSTLGTGGTGGDLASKAAHHNVKNKLPVPDIEKRFTGHYLVSDVTQVNRLAKMSHMTREWRLFILPHFACTMLVNGHVASCLAECVHRHRKLRLKFCKRLFQVGAFKDCVPQYIQWGVSELEKLELLAVPYIIDVVAVWSEQRLDYAWGWRVNYLLTKRMLLEDAMAWLSTLGGAYSSLGDYFTHHAEMAGQISMKQLQLALEMGDPFTVARCHMFWAYSLIQRGITRKARVIIRHVYSFAAHHPVKDIRLINMSLAAWKRLQHLHHARRLAQLAKHNNEDLPSPVKTLPFGTQSSAVCHLSKVIAS